MIKKDKTMRVDRREKDLLETLRYVGNSDVLMYERLKEFYKEIEGQSKLDLVICDLLVCMNPGADHPHEGRV